MSLPGPVCPGATAGRAQTQSPRRNRTPDPPSPRAESRTWEQTGGYEAGGSGHASAGACTYSTGVRPLEVLTFPMSKLLHSAADDSACASSDTKQSGVEGAPSGRSNASSARTTGADALRQANTNSCQAKGHSLLKTDNWGKDDQKMQDKCIAVVRALAVWCVHWLG